MANQTNDNEETENVICTQIKNEEIPEYINESQLAKRWGVSKKLLQKFRTHGGGPKFLKVGVCVRYRLDFILEYEKQNELSHTSEGK